MKIVIDSNLKQVDFHLFDSVHGKEMLLKKSSVSIDYTDNRKAFINIIKDFSGNGKIDAAGIRLRFGGDLFKNPTIVDKVFLSEYSSLARFFPFYIPMTHALLIELLNCFSQVPFYAFFETAFFMDLPLEEKSYAIPQEYTEKSTIRRFGSQGLYHDYQSRLPNANGTILSIVLDRQTTVCTVLDGKPMYISVGYTPLEGIMGRTTCGDIDPGVAFYLLRDLKQSFYSIDNLLKKESGFKGLTGFDLDIDDLFKYTGDHPLVKKAFEIYFNQILRHAGQALAVSGGLSGLVFGGRYCDVLKPIIYHFVKKMAFLGISLNPLPWVMENEKICTISDKNSKIPAVLCRVTLPEILAELTNQAVSS